MARVTHAAAHVSMEEVKHRLKTDPRPWCRQRWLIIYNALVERWLIIYNALVEPKPRGRNCPALWSLESDGA